MTNVQQEIKLIFSSSMANLRIYGSICFWNEDILQMFFKRKVRSSITSYKGSAYHINSFLWLEGAIRMK